MVADFLKEMSAFSLYWSNAMKGSNVLPFWKFLVIPISLLLFSCGAFLLTKLKFLIACGLCCF